LSYLSLRRQSAESTTVPTITDANAQISAVKRPRVPHAMPLSDLSLREARDVRRLFDGTRLRIARELRGLSQKGLAELAEVSAAAVSQFEKCTSTPTARTLVALGDALRFPIAYFRDDVAAHEIEIPAFFRSLRSASVGNRKQARAFAEVVREFAIGLETRVEFPALDVPRFSIALNDVRPEEVEEIASRVRYEWQLSSDQPLDDIVVLLERHGVVVTRADFGTSKIDAFSVAFDDHPVVVLCADKGLRDRSRFDAAHELGHLVMHEPEVRGTKEAESQASQFAGAFLMPRGGIVHELPSRPDWARLVSLKRKWGVSIGALLVRAKTLGVMAPEVYVQAVKAMSARGWRVSEPEPLGPPESPQLLRKAVAILSDAGLELQDLVELTCIPLDQIERISRANRSTRPRIQL
jgi:Zn-dependent peptidase ImmA (M78 family)/transcriptional regulator with XRE-family HTH domain